MTREEAIYLLKNTAWLAPSLEPVDEAIDMAIEALMDTRNCVLKLFGDCSYDETGCSDCEIKQTIYKALEVDIVRCEECKYYRPEFDACTVKGWNLSATHYPKVHESGFCYRGERRSDE